jgi:uncharacterized protein
MQEAIVRLDIESIDDPIKLRKVALGALQCPDKPDIEVWMLKRSLDARGSKPMFEVKVAVGTLSEKIEEPAITLGLHEVADKPRVIIVGAGPAGYFAAIELIEQGFCPIVLDRGKDVRARRWDLKAIQKDGIVNSDSNYCYGEGGAGTYSDGKLYTRSHKRGDIQKALRLLVEHGAPTDILIDAHPHIGSNKLPNVVANMRATIEHYGGKVIFDSLVTDFIIDNAVCRGVITKNGQAYEGMAVILATGHSARDIYQLLDDKGILIEAKPFALGVRIEHPQALIDQIQYKGYPRGHLLPASSYKLVCQVSGTGVFSFCMCPGGLIVPAATSPGEIVVNGMSMSRRDSKFANSGTVVAVDEKDFLPFKQYGALQGLHFQKSVEQAMFGAGDGSQKAPAQRLTDFANGRLSSTLGDTSYIPGLISAPLHDLLPKSISHRLREGVKIFGKQMKGYYTEEAQVVGTESRTSSPVRIPRDAITCMHPEIQGLFPCGEGAGYAGGIISAALDGQRIAVAIKQFVTA